MEQFICAIVSSALRSMPNLPGVSSCTCYEQCSIGCGLNLMPLPALGHHDVV
jgi:hypothetical protein